MQIISPVCPLERPQVLAAQTETASFLTSLFHPHLSSLICFLHLHLSWFLISPPVNSPTLCSPTTEPAPVPVRTLPRLAISGCLWHYINTRLTRITPRNGLVPCPIPCIYIRLAASISLLLRPQTFCTHSSFSHPAAAYRIVSWLRIFRTVPFLFVPIFFFLTSTIDFCWVIWCLFSLYLSRSVYLCD